MKQLIFYLAISIFLMVGYQNCSGYFSGGGAFSESSDCGASPAQMAPTFASTYQPFFSANTCNSCHIPGGIQSGSPFAGPDALAAVTAFDRIGGPTAVDGKLAAGHQGFNYETLKPELDAAKNIWDSQGFGVCESGLFTTTEERINFFEAVADAETGIYKVLPEMVGSPQTLTFRLDDGTFEPVIEGAYLTVQVAIEADADNNPSYYTVQNILISSPEQAIEIEGVTVRLNGTPDSENTWAAANGVVTGVDTPLNGANSQILILKSPGDPYTRTDAWSISFKSINIR